MKRITAIAAIAILGSTAAWAHDDTLGGNPDHSKGSAGHEGQKGEGDLYGSHVANPEDVTPNPSAKLEPIDPKEALHESDPEGYAIK